MGKKNKHGGPTLGRALIKDRFGNQSGRRMVSNDSMLHTTELDDGYEWGRLNLQSVTEESSFQEFLSTAELAGTEFQAEKLNIKFVNPQSNVGLLTNEEFEKTKDAHNKFKASLRIPRRPPWTPDLSPSELDRNEKDVFLEWRRSLIDLQEKEGILLTPYEKNLEFWRQLWRVIERSDVIVQIVDARNPLLFRCEDLEKYVKEVSNNKINLLLINKADYLTENQRKIWADYFESVNLKAIFYSALSEKSDSKMKEQDDENEISDLESLKHDINILEQVVEENALTLDKILGKIEKMVEDANLNEELESTTVKNSPDLLSKELLIELFRTIHKGSKVTEGITTIGLVGYPNVGKSSTINSLLSTKKVSVSATPGKTKHFQTLYLDDNILLCDCPGLVMPSFVFTKAEMILNGILPIDQMRDHVPPINLVTSWIPKHVIEDKYGIMIADPLEGEDPNRSPTAEELLNAYAYNRGFMTANGQPDNSRGARYILKDFMNGKLLYCHAPPNVDQNQFHFWPERQRNNSEQRVLPPREVRAIRNHKISSADIDKAFFNNQGHNFHSKGLQSKSTGIPAQSGSSQQSLPGKPWKLENKHRNKKKNEKLRRVYSHLDQH